MTASGPGSGALATVVETDGRGARFRKRPGSQGEVLAILLEGTSVELTGAEAEFEDRLWLEVRDADGHVGWVAADYLAAVESTR